MALQHIRSSTLDKRPQPASLSDGQLAINTNVNAPGVFFKDSNGTLVKVGPTFVGTTAPNSTPASGGASGNTLGEQWLDTSGTNPVLKIWDGSAWQSEAGEFVNVSGDTMTGALVMDNQQQIRFRETTANGTNYIALQAPASVAFDKTITLPDVTGTVVTTGDTGSVTSTMIADGTIVNADVNASAAIAGTKIDPDFGSQTVETTGVFSAAGGAAATPSITFTGDLNTGLWSPTADTIAASTGGSERLRIDSSGRLGLGTSTVDELLHLKGGSAASTTVKVESTATASERSSIHFFNGSVSRGRVGGSNDFDGLTLDSSTTESAAAIRFRTGGASLTTKMTLTSGGSLGIGTTSVGNTLHVYSTAATDAAQIQSSQNFSTLKFVSALNTNSVTIGTDGGGNAQVENKDTSKGIVFTAGGGEAARIDSSKRLLVGTTSTSDNSLIQIQGRASLSTGPAEFALRKGALPSSGDTIATIKFQDNNGNIGGVITAAADANWTSGSSHGTRVTFSTTADGASSPTERVRISQNGEFISAGIYNFTTSNAANVYIFSSGELRRSTSSAKYKTNVETLEDTYSDALLTCRPVWYRSTCDKDNPDWGWWGFIAEEVAEIDPRLVHWKTSEVTYDENGSAVETSCDPEPEGVAYDRFVPHLLNLIKRQKEQIEAMETRLAALEAS